MKKTLCQNFERVVLGFADAARSGNSRNPDNDAVLLFYGWLTIAITYFLNTKQIKESELRSIEMSAILVAGKAAPKRAISPDSIHRMRELANHALAEALKGRGDNDGLSAFIAWPPLFVASLADKISMDAGIAIAALARESLAVVAPGSSSGPAK